MNLGIIGLPQAGKTTVFNALTRGDHPVANHGGQFEVHTAVVTVPDQRVERLVDLFKPKKTGYAKITYADIAGINGSKNGNKNGGISGALLNQLNQVDSLLHVVRCFEHPEVAHPLGGVGPKRDIEVIDTELLLSDLIIVERKLERLVEERRKGNGRPKAVIEQEIALFERLQATLSVEMPLRDIELTTDEEKVLSGYGFLTRKPVLIVLNLADGQEPVDIPYPHQRSGVVALQGKLEMEIAQLAGEEAEAFLEEYGITEPGLHKVIRLSYDLLGMLSFFTVGEDEVRAWTARRGATALQASGAIHTDLQKGFIRADVISWSELAELGSLAEARAKGKLRLEGKEYLIQDGEIMHVRFNV